MKKIFLYLMMVPLAFSLNSCLEDSQNTGVLTDEAKTELANQDPDKIFKAAIQGAYYNILSAYRGQMSHNYFGQKGFDYLTSLMGNDMCMTGRFAMSLYHYMCDYWGQDYAATSYRWGEYYFEIDKANKILADIDPESTNSAVLHYKAQALALRGYAYSQLTHLYSFCYNVGVPGSNWHNGQVTNHKDDLCAPIVTETLTGNQPRATLEAVHTLIKEDLKAAYDLFEKLGKIHTADPQDFDGTVVAMYLARIYMTEHNWAEALKYARIVKSNYPILTGMDLLQGFSDLNLPDVVFAADVNTDNTGTYASYFSQMDMFSDGYAGIGVWRVAFKPLIDRIAANDIRLCWFATTRSAEVANNPVFGQGVVPVGFKDYAESLQATKAAQAQWNSLNVKVWYQACKFIGGGRTNLLNGVFDEWHLGDYIYLRSEEAYFMEAEILAHQNDLGGAKAALESIIRTRQDDYTYSKPLSKGDLLEEIIFHKRVEFWGEGMEFLDNRRLNIDIDRTDETWGKANNHFDAAKFKMEQHNTHLRYQIPRAEIDNNPEISENDQNPV